MSKVKCRHSWKYVGGCLCAWTVEYVRYKCRKCGKRKLICHAGGKTEIIRLKWDESFDQYEVP